jgi:integrase
VSLVKNGRYWHYDFWYRGVRYRGSTGLVGKTAARTKEQDKIKEIREGLQVQDINFDDFTKLYMKLHAKGKKSEKFYKWTTDVLLTHFGKTPLSRIGVREVEEFATKRRAKVKAATSNRSLAVLKSMFNKALDWGHARTNPVRRVKMDKEHNRREHFLSESEAAVLIEAAPEKVRPIIVAALHTGARRGELVKLDWSDVDFRSGTVHFRDTKNGSDRAVPMDDTLRCLLKGLRSRLAGEAVFLGEEGRLGFKELRNGFEKAVRESKIAGLRFHDLRHSYASFLVRSGVPLNTVRELLGHRSLEMTLRYAHLSPDHKREAVRVLDALLGGQSPQKSPQSFSGEKEQGA